MFEQELQRQKKNEGTLLKNLGGATASGSYPVWPGPEVFAL
jgi:hypothetical protein